MLVVEWFWVSISWFIDFFIGFYFGLFRGVMDSWEIYFVVFQVEVLFLFQVLLFIMVGNLVMYIVQYFGLEGFVSDNFIICSSVLYVLVNVIVWLEFGCYQ